MAKLIKNGKVVDDNWQVLPADATEVPGVRTNSTQSV